MRYVMNRVLSALSSIMILGGCAADVKVHGDMSMPNLTLGGSSTSSSGSTTTTKPRNPSGSTGGTNTNGSTGSSGLLGSLGSIGSLAPPGSLGSNTGSSNSGSPVGNSSWVTMAANIKQCVANYVSSTVTSEVSSLISNVSFSGLLNPSVSITLSQPCSGGGSMGIYGTAPINVGLGFPSVDLGTSSGAGQVTFSSCVSQTNCGFTININGTVSVTGIQDSTTIDVLDGNFLGQGYASVTASPLQLGIDGFMVNCSVSLYNALNEQGSASISPVGASGTAIFAVQGTACGFPINLSLTEPFSM